jgi:uncharacterized C2H2 Zn-finger protein
VWQFPQTALYFFVDYIRDPSSKLQNHKTSSHKNSSPIDCLLTNLRATSFGDPLIVTATTRQQQSTNVATSPQEQMDHQQLHVSVDLTIPLEWCAETGKLHVDKDKVKEWKCHICGFVYKNYKDWQQHLFKMHQIKVTSTFSTTKKGKKKD